MIFVASVQNPSSDPDESRMVRLSLDREAIDNLIEDLQSLKRSKDITSLKYFAPSHGWDGLSEGRFSNDQGYVGMVSITVLADDILENLPLCSPYSET